MTDWRQDRYQAYHTAGVTAVAFAGLVGDAMLSRSSKNNNWPVLISLSGPIASFVCDDIDRETTEPEIIDHIFECIAHGSSIDLIDLNELGEDWQESLPAALALVYSLWGEIESLALALKPTLDFDEIFGEVAWT